MRAGHVIALLLSTNFLLLALYLGRPASTPPATQPPPSTAPLTFRRLAKGVSSTPPLPVKVVTNHFEWAQLESENYRDYIQRLRAIGCPEQTIRDLVIADLEKLMAGRMRDIEGPAEPPKYWKTDDKELTSTRATLEQLEKKQALDFEKREAIQELLGIDLAAERLATRGEKDTYGARLGFLSPDKQARVRMILEKANREEMALREEAWLEDDQLSTDHQARLQEIAREKEQHVASILSGSELEQYRLWFSPSAYTVRESFAGLETSEEEFLAYYELQRAFDSEWEHRDPSTLPPEERQKYEAAEQSLRQNLEQKLGPDRYQEIESARDSDFRRLRETAAQFGLPRDVARDVFGFKRLAADQRTRLRNDATLSPAQLETSLQAIRDETEQAVVEALGPRAYKYYLRSGAGQWIAE